MAIIFETKNFVLESFEKPEIDRLEGGHVKVSAKTDIEDRSHLTPNQAIELMRFTIIAGEAMKRAMQQIGVSIGKINYQENGNWNPHLHVHLYCRAKSATMQKYGDPVKPGHKAEYNPLNAEDIRRIKVELEDLFKLERFSDSAWGLS